MGRMRKMMMWLRWMRLEKWIAGMMEEGVGRVKRWRRWKRVEEVLFVLMMMMMMIELLLTTTKILVAETQRRETRWTVAAGTVVAAARGSPLNRGQRS
jgi:hypothetical protein